MATLRLILGLIFAAALSQFPAFSDQYVQRLGGQVDALAQVAADFDRSARRAKLTRDEALAELSGSAFRDAHAGDMRQVFSRLDRASADLALLRAASPLERMALPHRLRDVETLRATWGDFRPAVPVTGSGFMAAALGFLVGWILAGLLAAPFRRREQPSWR